MLCPHPTVTCVLLELVPVHWQTLPPWQGWPGPVQPAALHVHWLKSVPQRLCPQSIVTGIPLELVPVHWQTPPPWQDWPGPVQPAALHVHWCKSVPHRFCPQSIVTGVPLELVPEHSQVELGVSVIGSHAAIAVPWMLTLSMYQPG